jgi:serine protease AprX
MRLRKGSVFVLLAIAAVLIAPVALVASPAPQAEPPAIQLKAVTFVPDASQAKVSPDVVAADRATPGDRVREIFLVQFNGPVEQGWKDQVAALGGEILDYIPDFAFKVRVWPGTVQQIAKLPSVRWIGLFKPEYKLSPDLKRGEAGLYVVQMEPGSDLLTAQIAMETTGARITQAEDDVRVVEASSEQLDALARIDGVAWIENYVPRENFSASAGVGARPSNNEYGGGNLMKASIANARGYDGSSQIVAVADTGIGGGTAATAHRDIPASRVVAIYNWPGSAGSCFATVPDDGAIDVDSGHGTHTSGSVLSGGDANGVGKGTAPAARLVFQSTENYATITSICKALYGYTNGYYLIGLPSDLKTLYQQAYNAGARIHSNSWGSAAAGSYTTDSANTDSFIWTNKDMVITFSAGNEGIDSNSDGVIDNDSIGAPATAKNVITVGASENNRSGNWQCDTGLTYTACASQGGQNAIASYGASWPSDYPANPIKDDPAAGNEQQMAAFSSRGPADDGRIKPDVVAPGTWILSTYSDLYEQGYDASANPKNGAWQYDGWGFPYNAFYKYMGGTSMSNPLTAGAAAVVKDYYLKAKQINARAALVKATLINSAVDLLDENNDGANDNDFPIPNNHEGWGFVNLDNATDGSAQFINEATSLATNGSTSFQYSVSAGAPFKVTLVWSDYAAAASASVTLVNDLDLEVTAPNGTLYRGNVFSGGWSQTGGSADRRNNVENVYIQSPTAGTWTVTIKGYNVPNGPQPFALVADGNFGAPIDTSTPTATPTITVTPTPTNTPTVTSTPTSTPVQSSTGYKSPSANAAVTSGSGDNNGFQTTPANGYAYDNAFAVDTNSGSGTSTSYTSTQKDRHIYSAYSFGGLTGKTIKGIQVQVAAKVDATSGAPKMYIELSSNGTTWTTALATANLSTTRTIYTLGGTANLWGRTWTPAEIASLRVRITNVASNTSRDFSLDSALVSVTYQ